MLMLKQIRTEKGFSQVKLAEAAGVPRRTVEDAEARGCCRIDTAYKLAVALGVTLNEMWIEDDSQA